MKNLLLTTMALLMTMIVFAQKQAITQKVTSSNATITTTPKILSLVAGFDAEKEKEIKVLIGKRLGNPSENEKGYCSWNAESSYKVVLRAQKLTIDIDKTKLTAARIKIFEQLQHELLHILNNG
ncbi:hypothetical protein [Chitinophaga nivalis]|uniref:Uncharacterized protein n=1 Tax=Chitinophaga nivalis TaxID=2991709 RepID=A0ABT3IMI4_9BACT|nr:hypothetical protein [Chitinophaga nivalis]MCW3465128.1 hypothetical protein [Chitinophaga nivalis]MCW3485180.1 hypothetical protein [Chitinophaga nivalis]